MLMCYSYQASINSFIMILASFFAVMMRTRTKYDTWIAIFLFYVGFMQIIEAMLWKDLNNTEKITKFTTIYLIGQVVLNNIFAYIMNPKIGIYSLSASLLLMSYFISTMNDYTYDTTVGENGHLVWNTYTKDGENVYWYRHKILIPILTILWFLPFFIILGKNALHFWPFIYMAGTYLYSAYEGIKSGEMASNWCFFTIFALLALVFVPAK